MENHLVKIQGWDLKVINDIFLDMPYVSWYCPVMSIGPPLGNAPPTFPNITDTQLRPV